MIADAPEYSTSAFAGDDAEGLAPHKLIPPIPLRIEQCGEVAVIDPRRRCGGAPRFGGAGDAEAGGLDHVEIVGAVADRQRVDVVEIEGFAQLDQSCELGAAAQARAVDLAV